MKHSMFRCNRARMVTTAVAVAIAGGVLAGTGAADAVTGPALVSPVSAERISPNVGPQSATTRSDNPGAEDPELPGGAEQSDSHDETDRDVRDLPDIAGQQDLPEAGDVPDVAQ
ncbi:hypothetical protein [Gordonia polyisoprenivorans]|uniref:hypothetical protein n=1 Tax=Gordonia polyisoprenivorans TaxID=84595 RepID=UPI0018CB84C7|nr:hypothetical protein [Gordonia polyisoprenivorans]